ncbi:TRAP transporter small permease subunit [Chloroflexota bacterium]
MPKVLVNYVRQIELMNTRIGKIFKFGLFVMLGFMTIAVVGRLVLKTPAQWTLEMGMFVLGAYYFIAGGYVLLRDEHVRMDAFYSRWNPRKRAIADAATFFLLAIYIIVLIRGGISDTVFSWTYGQHSSTTWGPMLAPAKGILTTGAIILLLQAVATFIRNLATIRGKEI